MTWITPSEIENYDFYPANEVILNRLKNLFYNYLIFPLEKYERNTH